MKKVYAVYVTDHVSGLLSPARCAVIGIYSNLDLAIRSLESFNEMVEALLKETGIEYEIKRKTCALDGEIERIGFITKENRKYAFVVEMKVDPDEKNDECFTFFSI